MVLTFLVYYLEVCYYLNNEMPLKKLVSKNATIKVMACFKKYLLQAIRTEVTNLLHIFISNSTFQQHILVVTAPSIVILFIKYR